MNNGEGSSSGAGFVKRSKPRSSAAHISSTYNDDDDAAATENVTRYSTPRRSMSQLEDKEEDTGNASNVVFRARVKGQRTAPSSTTASTSKATNFLRKERATFSALDEDEDEEANGSSAFEIRRSKLSSVDKQARRSGVGLSSTSSAFTGTTPRKATPLRPSTFREPQAEDVATEPSSSAMYTSKLLEELKASTPTTSSRASPTPTTGPGTRIDDPMVSQTAHLSLIDDSLLARSKYAADFAHDAIPSESVIRAAKEKRAKLRANAPSSTGTVDPSDDFISLAPYGSSRTLNAMEMDDGPHPHSRLQREEDEFGDGEEEFADYTGATERIPIGEKAEKEWKEKQRRDMEAAVRGDFDADAGPSTTVVEEMDEDEEEWERAQLQRTQPMAHRSQSRSREASPFRPAAIPTPTPLPSVGTCATRLALTLRELEQSIVASEAVVSSTTKELELLDEAQEENEADVEAMDEKTSFFNELEEFVSSLARFMEEKAPAVDEIEREAVGLIVKRNAIIRKRRSRWLDDRLEKCLGVKLQEPIIPDFAATDKVNEGQDEEDSLADISGLRAEDLDKLDESDQLSFDVAASEIVDKLREAFSDVQAPEYLDPAATSATTGLPLPVQSGEDHAPHENHPRSVVLRFDRFRRLYPEEYAQVWGGLSVAQIWEFYAREEMIPWDVFRNQESGAAEWWAGPDAVDKFRWYQGARRYGEKGSSSAMEDGPIGGDDEVVSSLVANVLVDKVIAMVRKGGFNPWSMTETLQALDIVDRVQRHLGRDHARLKSLIEAFFGVFSAQVKHLSHLLSSTAPQVRTGGVAAEAARDVLNELVDVLLCHLARWATRLGSDSDLGAPNSFNALIEELIGNVIEPLLGHLSHSSPNGTQQWMQEITDRISVVRRGQ